MADFAIIAPAVVLMALNLWGLAGGYYERAIARLLNRKARKRT